MASTLLIGSNDNRPVSRLVHRSPEKPVSVGTGQDLFEVYLRLFEDVKPLQSGSGSRQMDTRIVTFVAAEKRVVAGRPSN